MEVWKDVLNFEGRYMVSNIGRVKSVMKSNHMILSQGTNSWGYFLVGLYKDKKIYTISVHQLVAEAFLGHKRCGMKLVVNHIDFNRKNNNVTNLEIITQRENTTKKHLKSYSKSIGVSYNKLKKTWFSYVNIDGKRKYIGNYLTEQEAIDNRLNYKKNNSIKDNF